MAGFLSTLFGGGAEAEAADKNRALLQAYQPQSLGALQQGFNTGSAAINTGVLGYQPLAAMGANYGKAGDLYLNALGANGPQGQATAQNAFQTTPGYALSQAAGEDAINRQRGATGMYNSGNAGEDLLKFGQNNLYQTQYAPWMQGLQGAGQLGAQTTQAAAAGTAGLDTAMANLAQTYGTNQTGVYGNVLSGGMNANNLQAAGEAAGAKNLLGAGLSLATLGMGGFGGGGFGSSLFGQGLGSALGGAYGGSASSPVITGTPGPTLNAQDYGANPGFLAQYGLA